MAYNAHPIFNLIDEICEPMYRPVRSIMPNLSGIDLSPIILLIGLNLLQMIVLPPIFNLTRFL
jgi:YggT family protein